MTASRSPKRRITLAKSGAVLALAFAILEFLPSILGLPEYILPQLHVVLQRVAGDFGFLVGHAAITFVEAFAGLLIAAVLGVVVGAVSRDSRLLQSVGQKTAAVLQTIPIVAIAPIIILWGGPGLLSKVAMAALIGLPPLLVASIEGFSSPPRELVEVLTVMGTPKRKRFWNVSLPFAMTQVFVGLRISAALTTIGAIVAEYAGSTRGIGYVIMQASYRVDTSLLFAAVFFAVAVGLLLVAIVRGGDRLYQSSIIRR